MKASKKIAARLKFRRDTAATGKGFKAPGSQSKKNRGTGSGKKRRP
jgi:hypothetical protein